MKIRTTLEEFSEVNVLDFIRFRFRDTSRVHLLPCHTRASPHFSESSKHDEHSPLLEVEQRSRLNRKRRT